eukprot:TRINITY_DN5989_c4_g1_i1.p1 TRINITY_DN5989_c4_g1~~TRINITY_DN5989_c4_g1_i1.p1  ORF type:complete len:482 (+),score=79.35 TRINITY_DN5989_c4_g1_i1:57-1502(+)
MRCRASLLMLWLSIVASEELYEDRAACSSESCPELAINGQNELQSLLQLSGKFSDPLKMPQQAPRLHKANLLTNINAKLARNLDRECGFQMLHGSVLDAKGKSEPKSALSRAWTRFIKVQEREGRIQLSATSGRMSGRRYLRFLGGGRQSGQGIGNIFLGLQSALYLAMHSNRALIIEWPLLEELAFQPRFVDWRRRAEPERSVPVGKEQQFYLWNFGNGFSNKNRLLSAISSHDPGTVTISGNLGMEFLNLTGLFPGLSLKHARSKQRGCAMHFLFSSKVNLEAAVKRRLGNASTQVALQLRFGDFELVGGRADRRPIITKFGLNSVESVVDLGLKCASQICQQLRDRKAQKQEGNDCGIYFESDSARALQYAHSFGQNHSLLVQVPHEKAKHSLDGKADSLIGGVAGAVALSAHMASIVSFGAFGQLSQNFGPSAYKHAWEVDMDRLLAHRFQTGSKADDAKLCDVPTLEELEILYDVE